MKAFILPLILIICLTSCSEEETYCFDCTVTERQEDGSNRTTTFSRCGITEDEARKIEDAGTVMETPYKSHYVIIYLKKTVCVKQI